MGTRVAPLCLCSWLGFCKLRVRTTEEPDRSWFALSPDKWETGTPGREQMEVISEEIRWESSSQILGCCSLYLGADSHWSPWTWPMFSGSVYQSGKEKMVFTHFLVMLYRLNGAADRVFWDVSERKLKEVTHKDLMFTLMGGWWWAGWGHTCASVWKPEDTLGDHSSGTMYFTGLKLVGYPRMAGKPSAAIHLSLSLQIWDCKPSLSCSAFPWGSGNQLKSSSLQNKNFTGWAFSPALLFEELIFMSLRWAIWCYKAAIESEEVTLMEQIMFLFFIFLNKRYRTANPIIYFFFI